MKFPRLREYRGLDTEELFLKYLRTDLLKTLRELTTGLSRLTLLENFESFLASDVEIGAGVEVKIRHTIGVTPSQRIIVRGGTGAQNIVDGDTNWDSNYVYLKNTGASSVTVSVVFLR